MKKENRCMCAYVSCIKSEFQSIGELRHNEISL